MLEKLKIDACKAKIELIARGLGIFEVFNIDLLGLSGKRLYNHLDKKVRQG